MWVKELSLRNFRNYNNLNLKFEKGVNYIQGNNGEGKTSLVEAIGLLPLCKSIRQSEEKDIIKINEDFLSVEALIESEHEEKLKIVISTNGKMIESNGVEVKRVSDIAGIVKVVSFLPRDVELFKELPLKRRKFIDSNISMLNKKYLLCLSEYNKYLNEIRTLIKNNDFDKALLQVLVQELTKRGLFIQKKRREFVSLINQEIKTVASYLENNQTTMELVYCPSILEMEQDKYSNFVYQSLLSNLQNKLGNRIQILGIHGDDLQFKYNKTDLSTFGSQGQNRLSVICLKLTLFKIMKEKFKSEPIVILDDVLSELDNLHQEKLINLLTRIEQVFITGTSIQIKDDYTLFTAINNTVRRNL